MRMTKQELLKLAQAAFAGTSFDPEQRAAGVIREYDDALERARSEIMGLAKSEQQRTVAEAELARFEEGFTKRFIDWLNARTRIVSPMIAGPARFPVARMEKLNAIEHKRSTELWEFYEKALRAMRKRVERAQTPEQATERQVQALVREAKELLGFAQKYFAGETPFSLQLMKASFVGKVERAAGRGEVQAVKAALAIIEEGQAKLPKPIFTTRHSVWKLRDVKPKAPATGKIEVAFDGGTVVNNLTDERVQIFFEEKPSQEVRQKLKYNGFRWAPSVGAWQRKNTSRGLYVAATMLGIEVGKLTNSNEGGAS